jgi:hypothetical protein
LIFGFLATKPVIRSVKSIGKKWFHHEQKLLSGAFFQSLPGLPNIAPKSLDGISATTDHCYQERG